MKTVRRPCRRRHEIDGISGRRSRSGDERERKVAGDCRHGIHQERAQPCERGLAHGPDFRVPPSQNNIKFRLAAQGNISYNSQPNARMKSGRSPTGQNRNAQRGGAFQLAIRTGKICGQKCNQARQRLHGSASTRVNSIQQQQIRVNGRIRAREVRVIVASTNEQLGVMKLPDAIRKAVGR